MKRHSMLMAVTILLSATAAHARPAVSTEFSADIISRGAQGEMQMKMYQSGDKSRMEMPQQTMIVRRDLGVMWILMPAQGIYMEQPIDYKMLAQSSPTIDGEVEREPLGSEEVDGQPADKFKVTYEANGERNSVYQWLTSSEMPVRTQAVDGSWTVDFKNMQVGPQDATLFDAPADLQKMQMPSMGEMMRQAMSGQLPDQEN